MNELEEEEMNQRLQLMLRKGVYPYEYMSTWEKFEETSLPPQAAFYSSLSQENITSEEYEFAKQVFNKLNMRDLRDYHNFYLASDVLLLSDTFEAFRALCLEHFEIDPAHCYTSPGMFWQSALKKTGITLDLLTDIDQFLFIEDGVRGGVSQISHRYAKANNPLVPDYDISKRKSHIIYLDFNNLYGYGMSQCLPQKDFRWLSSEEIESLNILSIHDDSETGYILEVDLG